jgi:hypothetical protein
VTVLPFTSGSPFDSVAYRRIAVPWQSATASFPAS